jgi:hypothetical protein
VERQRGVLKGSLKPDRGQKSLCNSWIGSLPIVWALSLIPSCRLAPERELLPIMVRPFPSFPYFVSNLNRYVAQQTRRSTRATRRDARHRDALLACKQSFLPPFCSSKSLHLQCKPFPRPVLVHSSVPYPPVSIRTDPYPSVGPYLEHFPGAPGVARRVDQPHIVYYAKGNLLGRPVTPGVGANIDKFVRNRSSLSFLFPS